MNHDCSINENASLLLVVILLPFALLVVSGDLVVQLNIIITYSSSCTSKINNWEKSS